MCLHGGGLDLIPPPSHQHLRSPDHCSPQASADAALREEFPALPEFSEGHLGLAYSHPVSRTLFRYFDESLSPR